MLSICKSGELNVQLLEFIKEVKKVCEQLFRLIRDWFEALIILEYKVSKNVETREFVWYVRGPIVMI